MLSRLSKLYRRHQFKQVAHQVRQTPPSVLNPEHDLVIVSLLYHDAMDMSLLALKSFIKKLPYGRVEVLDDGSLTQEDYALLYAHIPDCTIVKIADVDTKGLPTGGCWERLIHILELSKSAYVVQVDTDTLTIGNLNEVYEHWQNQTGFSIGGPQWPERVNLNYLHDIVASWKSDHIQSKAEQNLVKVESLKLESYLRGCAAFAGFPKGLFNFEDLINFSLEMEKMLGKEKWHSWGSEQFASNVMLSTIPNSEVLPWPKYQNYKQPTSVHAQDDTILGAISVFHFIGTYRFDNGLYSRLAKHVLKSLNK